MVAQYIATRSILDLCERYARRPGERVSRQWWEQARIYFEGAKKNSAEAEADSDSESDLDLGEEESSGASGSSGAEWSGAEE